MIVRCLFNSLFPNSYYKVYVPCDQYIPLSKAKIWFTNAIAIDNNPSYDYLMEEEELPPPIVMPSVTIKVIQTPGAPSKPKRTFSIIKSDEDTESSKRVMTYIMDEAKFF